MIQSNRRRGIIAIMAAFSLIMVMGLVAMAIDLGYILMTRTELQACCDASALAGGTELLPGLGINKTKTPGEVASAAKATAVAFAAQNHAGDQVSVYADSDRDIDLGQGFFDPSSGSWVMNWGVTPYNMVGATLHRDQAGSTNGDGPLPLIFAPIIGTDTQNLLVDAVAVQMPAAGFYVPPGSDATSNIMPFAYRYEKWYRRKDAQDWFDINGNDPSLIIPPPVDIEYLDYDENNPLFYAQKVNSQGNPVFDSNGDPVWVQDLFDHYGYIENPDGSYTMTDGPDGILEVDLYPEHPGNTGNTAGNSGTIDLGNTNNATPEIARQILYGLNDDDFAAMAEQGMLTEGGELVVNDENVVEAEGETGISGGPIASALNDILGEPRAIALFTQVQDPGDTSIYTLVELAGMRVMNVSMTGNPKHVWIQPAKLVDGTAIPILDEPPGDDDSIFTPLILIE